MNRHLRARSGLLFLAMGTPLIVGCGGGDGAFPQQGGTGGSIPTQTGGATARIDSGPGGRIGSGGQTTSTGGSAGSGGSSTGGAGGPGGGPDAGFMARPDAGTSDARGPDAGGGGAPGTSDGGPPPSGKMGKIKVWMAGDSTMQPCGGTCPCGWGSQFQPLFNADATVVNSAAGGRSIQTWLYDPNVTTTIAGGECVISPKTFSARWQAMLDPATGMKPGDYLFIEFGINDGDPTCNRHVGTALFQSYLTMMAQAAKDRGAQAILLTSTSFMQCTGTMVTPNRGFGPQTKAAATASGATLIDLTQLSANLYTSLGLCPNDLDFTSTTSAVGKFFCDDHTHFEPAGAAQVAGVVARALRDQNIGLAAYLE
jgi:lysophospholipase L1-like esterase